MEFENRFDLEVPIEQVWDAMLDIERVAPCVPGAEVLERTGDDAFEVGIKVKVGPVSMQYRGQVEIVDKDPASHSAVMSARARESRGQGTATASVRMHLEGENGTTHGRMITEVALSGRAAAMGQGVIQEVSGRIVGQFAENLAGMHGGAQGAEAQSAEAPPPEETPTQVREAPQVAAPPPPPPPPPAPAAADSLDVVPIVSGVVAKRLRDPRVIGGIALVLLLLLRRRR
ncbi:MAG: SRPBCC family protein [Thermoleophilaceae bacterium]